ncbi:hypothetical protein D8Y22_18150 [Salinadaptatus halalkaliphilus]|uniref:Halobacterial output domain-containing protein n=2 Tax=Salinadaptatus halalkaliphilus TaxID=2419781 RepID=A0A4S3THQ7_9EURY|nr:hypothetical protein D8Y22_18150 [Salinadaptatus halalkaliphilus]
MEFKSHSTPLDRKKRPSLRVVERVAEAEAVGPVELRPPLHDIVDSGALDHLFESARDRTLPGVATFRYRGYEVTVHADGRVALE